MAQSPRHVSYEVKSRLRKISKRERATGSKREVTGTARATARNVCNRDSLGHGEEEKRSIERQEQRNAKSDCKKYISYNSNGRKDDMALAFF